LRRYCRLLEILTPCGIQVVPNLGPTSHRAVFQSNGGERTYYTQGAAHSGVPEGLPFSLLFAAPLASAGIANLSDVSYPIAMGGMKGITIKLPEALARQLREQARQSGRSVAALIRERIEAPPREGGSVYGISPDLAGILSGKRLPATNARARFGRP
jgi:hypothetical protein